MDKDNRLDRLYRGPYLWNRHGKLRMDRRASQLQPTDITNVVLRIKAAAVDHHNGRLALPSFFVLNSLFGLREDFGQAVRAVVSAQAGLVIILASLTPLTVFFYVSNTAETSYSAAILFNALMFAVASISAQRLLALWYAPLIRKNSRHRSMMVLWIFLFAFVGIQMGYVLRPFIGNPTSPTSFLRENPFENAYVRVWKLVLEVVGAV